MWEKTTDVVVSIFIFYYKEIILKYSTGKDSYQHVGNHLQKAPNFSHSLAPTGSELQSLDIVYWHPPEGSSYPLI